MITSPALPWQQQVRVVDTRVWGLSQTRIAPLAFMFLFLIITTACTWNGGNNKKGRKKREKQAGDTAKTNERQRTGPHCCQELSSIGRLNFFYLLIIILLQFISLWQDIHHKIIQTNVCGGGMGTLQIFVLSDMTLNKMKAMKEPHESSSNLWNLKWAPILVQPSNKSVCIKSGPMHTPC